MINPDILRGVEENTVDSLSLNFSDVSLGDLKGLADLLRKNTSVRHLFLCGNNIDDKGAEVVSYIIKANENIFGIYLAVNKITDAGAKVLYAALEKYGTLQEMTLNGNNIKTEIIESINYELKKNKSPDAPPKREWRKVELERLRAAFSPEKWAGKINEMQKAWRDATTPIKEDFDFAAALTAARLQTLQAQTKPRVKIVHKPPQP